MGLSGFVAVDVLIMYLPLTAAFTVYGIVLLPLFPCHCTTLFNNIPGYPAERNWSLTFSVIFYDESTDRSKRHYEDGE